MQLAKQANKLSLVCYLKIHLLFQIWSLPAPKKQDGNGHTANSRLQNGSPQTNVYNVHYLYSLLPLEGALHLLLLLVGLFDLVGDPGQELLKIGQEVRLISPELRPEAAHLAWTAEWEKEKTQVRSFHA